MYNKTGQGYGGIGLDKAANNIGSKNKMDSVGSLLVRQAGDRDNLMQY
jgi:hypothetical protein